MSTVRASAEKISAIREMVRNALATGDVFGPADTHLGPRSAEISIDMADGTRVLVSIAAWERLV